MRTQAVGQMIPHDPGGRLVEISDGNQSAFRSEARGACPADAMSASGYNRVRATKPPNRLQSHRPTLTRLTPEASRPAGKPTCPRSTSAVEVGTHPEVVVIRRGPVAERRAPECAQSLSLPKIGHLDPGFEEGTGRVNLPTGEQGTCPLQDHSAVHSDLFRRRIDHRQADRGPTGGQ